MTEPAGRRAAGARRPAEARIPPRRRRSPRVIPRRGEDMSLDALIAGIAAERGLKSAMSVRRA
ncbi:MAG TPA: hypothetical protein PKA64_07755, partial [Myxococcota bacterium]|nr:hypothetical protein [Myxococcota bacterium]